MQYLWTWALSDMVGSWQTSPNSAQKGSLWFRIQSTSSLSGKIRVQKVSCANHQVWKLVWRQESFAVPSLWCDWKLSLACWDARATLNFAACCISLWNPALHCSPLPHCCLQYHHQHLHSHHGRPSSTTGGNPKTTLRDESRGYWCSSSFQPKHRLF